MDALGWGLAVGFALLLFGRGGSGLSGLLKGIGNAASGAGSGASGAGSSASGSSPCGCQNAVTIVSSGALPTRSPSGAPVSYRVGGYG